MNLINRWQMFVAIVCGSCLCQSVAAYQVDVYFVATNAFSSAGPSDLFQFDESGPQLAKLEIPETNGGQSLATNNNNIFIAESSAAINRYDLQGNFLGEFANVSRLAGQNTIGTAGPSGQTIETDRSGNLYTTFGGFRGNSRTSFRLDQSGAISATFSHPDLVFPKGIDADADGDVFILQAAGGSNKLFQFDASGNYVNDFSLQPELPHSTQPRDIAINETTNELFIADSSFPGAIHIFDLSTQPPVLVDTLPALGIVIDVFVEQVSGRIFGTTETFSQTLSGGINFGSEGFEVSRDGDLVTTYAQNTPRSQTHSSIIAIPVTTPEPTTILGDVNQDGLATFLDISPFIGFLTSGTYLKEADVNLDDEVNFLDITPLIAILAGG